jgi:ribonuclease VapC
MIAADGPALTVIMLNSDTCAPRLATNHRLLISAGIVAEPMIFADRRNVGNEVAKLIYGLGFELVSVSAARRAIRWRDRHPGHTD